MGHKYLECSEVPEGLVRPGGMSGKEPGKVKKYHYIILLVMVAVIIGFAFAAVHDEVILQGTNHFPGTFVWLLLGSVASAIMYFFSVVQPRIEQDGCNKRNYRHFLRDARKYFGLKGNKWDNPQELQITEAKFFNLAIGVMENFGAALAMIEAQPNHPVFEFIHNLTRNEAVVRLKWFQAFGFISKGIKLEDFIRPLILANLAGTFYRCPADDQPPFVEVRDRVHPGMVVGRIGSVQVKATVDGIITRALADNARPVQYGDALFEIKAGR